MISADGVRLTLTVDLTIRVATSWVGLFSAYVVALIVALAKFHDLAGALKVIGLPPWSGLLVITAFPVLALVFSTVPSILEQRRVKRYSQIKVNVRDGYFTLRPREKEEGFERVDNAHDEILRWLEEGKGPVLYLTGASGTGKSSILSSWVIPKLRRRGDAVISIRGYEDVLERLKSQILEPGFVWTQPSRLEGDLQSLLARAGQRLGEQRLIIIIDQFEEFLILKDKGKRKAFQEVLSSLTVGAGVVFVLVYRPEYEGLIEAQSWPRLQLQINRKVIFPFTENVANEFLQRSGLTLNPDLMRLVLREAAEIEQGSVGLIRPVTLNLCGLVLSRFSNGLPRKFRGGIIRGFLRESLSLPEVRGVADKIIPYLITDNVTKRPRTIAELVRSTHLTPAAVRAFMRRLGESDRAIVRPLDADQEIWEVSHDFLVPLLDSIVARRTTSLWRRLRPWMPWLAASIVTAVSISIPIITPRSEDLYRRIAIDERERGRDSLDVAKDLVNLGAVLTSKAEFRDAVPLFRRAVGIFERRDARSTETLFAFMGLANALQKLGEYEEAEVAYRRALAISQLTASRRETGTILGRLASLRRTQALGMRRPSTYTVGP